MALFNCPNCNKQYSLKDTPVPSVNRTCPVCNSLLQPVQSSGTTTPSGRFSFFHADIPDEVREGMKAINLTIAGKYILSEKIGQGGMGAVYKAWDVSLKRYVAVKIILPSLIDPSSQDVSAGEVIERFISEAQTAAKLIHPNILQVYETGVQDDTYYIIMEYVNGGSLNEYWAQKQKSPGPSSQEDEDFSLPSREDILEYAALMKDVIKAIDHAHNYNIIHRDIKPANILLSRGQHGEIIPKISDFGLAKEVTSDRNITVAGTIVGTPAYMSPEQSLALQLDNKSDIFSLGAVLYRLCTGTDPFYGASYIDVIKAVAVKDPIPPRRINGSIDRDMEIIILKAMEKEKERRYVAASEFAEDMERYLRGEPIIARPASMAYKVSKNIRRNKIAFAGVAVAVAAVAAVVIWLVVSRHNLHKAAGEYLTQGDGFFNTQNWKEAKDYYIKYMELIRDDASIKEKIERCAQKIEDEKKAGEDAQTAWLHAEQVFREFYKENANMDKVWRHIDDSIAMLGKSIDLYPTPMGYFFRAMLYKEKGMMEEAEKDLTLAIKLKPDFDLAYIIRGTVYFETYINSQSKELEQKAARDFASIKSFDSIPEQFKINKVIFENIMVYRQDPEKGFALLKEGFEKYDSEEFLLWFTVFKLKSIAFERGKSAEEAEESIDKAIAMKPQYAKAYVMRSMIKNHRKDYEGAIEDLTKALKINPNNPSAYRERADIRVQMGDYNGAMEDYNEAARQKPNNSTTYFFRGYAKDQKDDFAGALADYETALKLDPANDKILVARSTLKSRMGDIGGSIADLYEAIRLNPYSDVAYFNLSLIFLERGDIDKSIAYATESIRLNPDIAETYVQRGYVRNAKGDQKGAIEDYTKAIQLDPSLKEAYRKRAIILRTMGENDKAIIDFNKVIELSPDSAEDYYRRALAKSSIGDNNGAIEDFSACLRLKPAYGDAYRGRGLARNDNMDIDGAIEDFTKAIELDAGDSMSYYTRGLIRCDMGNMEAALEDLNKAIQIEPDNAIFYLARSLAKYSMGDMDGVTEDMSTALRKEPQLLTKINKSILSDFERGRWENAAKWLDVTLTVITDNPIAYKYRAHARVMLEDTEGAIADYSSAIRLSVSDAKSYYERAKLRYKRGDFEGAIADFSDALKIEPFNTAACLDRGTAWYNINEMDKAISDYTLVITMSPDDADAYLYRGDAFIKKGDTDKAIEDYSKTISLDPTNALAWLVRGAAKYEKKDYDGAIEDYTEAIRLDPDNPQAYANRGVNLFDKGKFREALSDMEKAAALNPALKDFLNPYLEEAGKKLGQ